ncbi:PIG-L deacetylase family protein [Marivivens sp. LCG002]|uniref:PIG-L deacetylase family protein n=1 Tax=Marivivens sp. LCG002 TaxID=3051171 RepID=UPI002555690F|nr:PIG-L deacetylase family protein [Marivivens sp. LCG002]WIV51405.1 PIG-L deacetylase family protein [Marivivens sp. LCG002]
MSVLSKPIFGETAGRSCRILLLSAHTDDCEIGMGATIARLVDSGFEIKWVVFCNAWQSLPKDCAQDTLLREQIASARALGVSKDQLEFHNIPVRRFPEFRQDILENLVEIGRRFSPDIVFCPSLQDRHQDHLTLAQEAERAFKRTKLLGYVLPWNITKEIRNLYVEVSEEHFDRKVRALSAYQSQAGRGYFRDGVFESISRASGAHIDKEFCETFEVIKWVEAL